MPIYTYKALSETGSTVTGEVAAACAEDLSRELSDKGLLVQGIRKKYFHGITLFRKQRIKDDEFLLFCRELLALSRAGLTITDALILAANRPEQPTFSQVLNRVIEDINGGSSFSDACRNHPDIFNRLFISALETSERTGDMATTLVHYTEHLKRNISINKRLKQALAYPTFLLFTLVAALGILFTFVMPRFTTLYMDFGADLPLPTRFLLTFVENSHIYGPLIFIIIIALWVMFRAWLSGEKGQIQYFRIRGMLPLVGPMTHQHAVAQMTYTLSSLLNGGTTLVDAMKSTRDTVTNRDYAVRLDKAINMIVEGCSLSDAARENNLLQHTAIKMIEVGEASGNLGNLLNEVAIYNDENLEYQLSRLMSFIEPALMLIMGVLLGGIIIVMYLPVFSMADIIK